jgi:hypothetical protein
MAEFNDIVFSQFETRLKDHHKKVGGNICWSDRESNALMHDRCMFLRQMENCHGEPVFDCCSFALT